MKIKIELEFDNDRLWQEDSNYLHQILHGVADNIYRAPEAVEGQVLRVSDDLSRRVGTCDWSRS